jgi:hypothetical protein
VRINVATECGPLLPNEKTEASQRSIAGTQLGQCGIERHITTSLEEHERFVDVANPSDVCRWRISSDAGASIQDGWLIFCGIASGLSESWCREGYYYSGKKYSAVLHRSLIQLQADAF